MTKKVVNEVADKVKAVLAPVQKLSAMNVANVEKLVALQLASLEAYSQLGVNRLKAAVEVTDVDGLQAFVAGQNEFVKAVSEKLVADAKVVSEVSQTFVAEAQKLAQESVATLKAA